MLEPHAPDTVRPPAEKVSVSLFPQHRQIVQSFADESQRTFSNALQVIIVDWQRGRITRPDPAAGYEPCED